MRKTVLATAIALATAGFSLATAAGEGMWVPQQLPEIAGQLKKAGLKLDPKQLADLTGDPMGAVVSLGGCTASFVSPQGLVVTNHHCAAGAIQLNSPRPTTCSTRVSMQRPRPMNCGWSNAAYRAGPAPMSPARCRPPLPPPTGHSSHRARGETWKIAGSPPAKRCGSAAACTLSWAGNTYRVPQLEIKDCAAMAPGQVANTAARSQLDVAATGDSRSIAPTWARTQARGIQQGHGVPAERWLRSRQALREGDSDGARLPGQHQRYALAATSNPPARDLSHRQQALQGAGGDGERRRREESGHRGEVRRFDAGLGEHAQELRRPDGRLHAHGRPGHQARARTGGAGLVEVARYRGRAGPGRASSVADAGRRSTQDPRA